MKIAVLIPCLNEEKTIKKTIIRMDISLRRAICDLKKKYSDEDINYEIYVIDNGSIDKTVKEALKERATILRESAKGKGRAVKKALLMIDADVYVMIDGDDTYCPYNIYSLLEPVYLRRADMVIGDRIEGGYHKKNKKIINGIGNRIFNSYMKKRKGISYNDILSGFRVFSKKFTDKLNIRSTGFEIETELALYAKKHEKRVLSVPVKYKNRPKKSHSKLHVIFDGIKILRFINAY